ncbi:hypothetical protein ACUN0C_00515 [Faunimonas sp. B44]|uniref:hypothetical protein n=1 Tax=Faunimonas sp. B44 TaxID=3461493 RepID=UPI0040445FCD
MPDQREPATGKADPPGGTARSYSAEEASQGEIVLRRKWQRVVFIGGLVGIGFLLLVLLGWSLGR